METPRPFRQETVAAQSAPVAKFVIEELPLASEAMIAARCEIDLSPGRRTRPEIRRAGRILIVAMIPTKLRISAKAQRRRERQGADSTATLKLLGSD